MMPEEFDKELFYLLRKHFDTSWEHQWTGTGDGFYLRLTVWDVHDQDDEEEWGNGECSNDGELGQTVNLVALPK